MKVFGPRPSFVLCALCAVLAPAAAAQEIRGVVQTAAGQPLPNVHVSILDQDQRPIAATFTDADGSFALQGPSRGEYFLRMARTGFLTLFDRIRVAAGEPLDVRGVMHRGPIAVESLDVTVEGRVPRLVAVGFYERMSAGFGHFLEREDILESGPGTLTDALRRLTGVRTIESLPGRLQPGLFLHGGRTGYCRPTLYVDGVIVALGGDSSPTPVRPDEWVGLQDVEGVEVYTGPASAPLRFQSFAGCGVVMIWTRHADSGRSPN